MARAPIQQTIDVEVILEKAERSASATPRPFVRWAGSKQKLLPHIAKVIPRRFGTYHEPFLGSGALFFLLQPKRAMLNDSCADLILTYEAVRDSVHGVIKHFSGMKQNQRAYYRIRESRSAGRLKYAAEFIYLNKTCWNGLYRVNSDGKFNVPYGRPRSSHIYDKENLLACSKPLANRHVRLRHGDFEKALSTVKANDFVFLDPPYVTRHNNNGFVDYNERLFSWDDQKRLAKIAKKLSDKGAAVVVCNANHSEIIQLYKGFDATKVTRSSTLASSPEYRGVVSEVILVS